MCDHFLHALSGRRNGGYLKEAALIFSVLLMLWPVPSFAQAETAAAVVKKPVEAPKPLEVQEVLDVQKPDETASYHYDAKGKIDPFKPFLNLEVAKVTTKPIRNFPRTPLEEVGLDQFKLVGIAIGSNRKAAMVEDPKKKGYIIGEGTVIGHNGGKVVEILRDRVIVEERIPDATGKNKMQRTVIKLHKDEKEGML